MTSLRSTAAALVILLAGGGCTSSPMAPSEGTPAIVIAHRGSSYDAPEHTFAAYDLALQNGVDYIEQDIHRTSDGVLVVLHDATLERTARGEPGSCAGSVREKTLAQLKTCDAGSWFNAANPSRARAEFASLRIPTLAEVLDRYQAGTRYYIEIKNPELYPGIEADLIAMLTARGLLLPSTGHFPRVFIQSFDEQSLKRVSQLTPTARLILLLSAGSIPSLTSNLASIATYAAGVGVPYTTVNAALVDAVHSACLLIHPFAVDDPAVMKSLLAMGVDGMFTNRPALRVPEFLAHRQRLGSGCEK
ncbi:MAG TPA: glycerophosphodiester phosphodiesterase [Gemmatimonadaceae bacterium]|nr:glycerophosphodiester phosphodiesterase [Gemmatimonadaceae bacterium]